MEKIYGGIIYNSITTTSLWVCGKCGAAVLDVEKHSAHHTKTQQRQMD